MQGAPAPAQYRVCILGCGGVGGYCAARLKQAGTCSVSVVQRPGAHAQALQQSGLKLSSVCGDAQVTLDSVVFDAADVVKPIDLVVVALKTWQLEGVQNALTQLVGPTTLVWPVQNGIDTPDVLAGMVGAEHVLGGYAKITSLVRGPGHIVHDGVALPLMGVGLLPATSPEWGARELQRMADAWAPAPGIKLVVEPDIRTAMWRKPATLAVMREAMLETAAVARADGSVLTPDDVDKAITIITGLPPGNTPSMWRDMQAGRPSELFEQAGAVVRVGERLGVPTPTLRTLVALLQPQELLHRGEIAFPRAIEDGAADGGSGGTAR